MPFCKRRVNKIQPLENCWKVETEKSTYAFDYVIVATGGHSGYELLKNLDIKFNHRFRHLSDLQQKKKIFPALQEFRLMIFYSHIKGFPDRRFIKSHQYEQEMNFLINSRFILLHALIFKKI